MPAGKLDPVLYYLRRQSSRPAGRDLTDAQLLDRYTASGDEDAFATLVHRHGRFVRAVCRRVLRREQDADDAFQATFLIFASRAASIRKAASVASWLYGVAYRTAMNARRADRRRRTAPPQSQRTAQEQPVTEAALREVQAILDDEVNRLAEKYRAPFVLCCLNGKSRAEAAAELGWKEGTVSSRLSQARQQLQRRLARRGVTLSAALCAVELSRTTAAAAVSVALLDHTVRSALSFAVGDAVAADLVSVEAAALTRGVIQGMLTTRLKVITVVLLAAGLTAVAAGTLDQAPTKTRIDAPQKSVEPAADPTDRCGDPLPAEAVARVGTVRLRHGAPITSLSFTADGRQLLADGSDGVRVWDVATGRELRHLAGKPDARIWGACHSADCRRVALSQIGSAGRINVGPIQVCDVATGKTDAAFPDGMYTLVRLSPDGKVLAATDFNAGLTLWDVASGRQRHAWRPHGGGRMWTAEFTSDGKAFLTGGHDQTVRLWNVATGEELWTINGLLSSFNSLALSPDGNLLAVLEQPAPLPGGGGFFEPIGRIELWSTAGGKKVRELEVRVKPGAPGPTRFRALAFSPGGKTLAAGGVDTFLRGWDPATGKEVWRIEVGPVPPSALAFSPDGKTLAAAGGGAIRLFDVGSGQELPRGVGPHDEVRDVALTPDGRTLAAQVGVKIFLWDPATGRERGRLEGHDGQVLSLHLAAGRPTFFSTGLDRTVRAWDPASGKELRRVPGLPFDFWPPLLAVSADAKLLALRDRNSVLLADAVTGREVRRLEVDTLRISGANFTADGRTLVLWDTDRTARVWDVAAGKQLRRIPCQDAPLAPGDYNGGYVAALSPDGTRIAFGTSSRLLVLRELATGKELRCVKELVDAVSALAISPDSRVLAWSGSCDPQVRLLEVATGRQRHVLAGHKGRVTSLAFSADGTRLVSASSDTTALVWDLTGGPGARGPVGPTELDVLWRDLAGNDAARAYRAVRRLAAVPAEAVPYLRDRLPPITVDPKRLARLIADLDSERFAVREQAQQELEEMCEVAVPSYHQALAAGPTLEVRRRLEGLLTRQAQQERAPLPERRRALRVLEVLEAAGTPAAQRVLLDLAAGSAESRISREAREASRRLECRPAVTP